MTVEIIAPYKSEEGITFYISNDGKETGISIRGLERLIGQENSNSRLFAEDRNKLLYDMSLGVQRKDIPESLKPAWGNVFNHSGQGLDGAKIVMEKAAVKIIKYYALDKVNKIAIESLSKFAEIGFNTWVKEITNYSKGDKYDNLLEMMQKVLDEVKEVRVKVEKLDRMEGTMVTWYPGAKHITEGWSSEENKHLLGDKNIYTTKDWLNLNNISLDKGSYHSFSLLTAETYRTLTGKEPSIKYKPYKRKNGKMSKQKEGNGYKIIDFYILEACYKKLCSKV